MKMSGAQIIVEQLCAHGISTVFGYPGGQVLPLYDELYKNSDRIEHVITAHEQGAVHAADGFARVSGKAGVVIATSGPGATNLVTGIANAYLDSIPLVAITGNVTVPLLGRDSFQEVDIAGITQPIVKHNFVVRDVKSIEHILTEAFRIACSGRRGPVLVDVPKSVQVDFCEYSGDMHEQEALTPPDFDLTDAVEAIKSCKRPYIYAGGGVLAGGAEKEVAALSELISAPVGLSMMGLTSLPFDHRFNLGMSGMHGKYAAIMAQSECDLMIALGARFSDRATGNAETFRKGRIIIHIDIDPSEIDKNISSHIGITGDVKAVLEKLIKALPPNKNDDWLARIEELKEMDASVSSADFIPGELIKAVARVCDKDTVIATDVGQHQLWVMQNYPFSSPRKLLTSGGLGTMGFGMGAAIGGCIASGRKRTVLFTGDGSFGMNLNELSTAVSQNLPLIVVILNNGVLGMVRQWQTMFFGQRYSQTTLSGKTDYSAVAKAFGAHGYKAANLSELNSILNRLPEDGPVVIDCQIDMDEKVLPMIPPGGSVKDIVVKG